MTVKELKAVLENIVDTLDIYLIKDNVFVELLEQDVSVVTLDAGDYIGPTVLLINIEDGSN